MTGRREAGQPLFLVIVAMLGWLVPGAGHFAIHERARGVVIFVSIVTTFVLGLYIGSIGVVNPVHAKGWYVAQVMNSPAVALLGHLTASGMYRPVYGRPNELGQVYTGIAGLLNLLCIVNAVYLAHRQKADAEGA